MLSNKKSLLNFFFFLASFTLVSSLFLALDNSIRAQISNQNEAYSLSPIIKEVYDSVVNISVKGTVEVNNPLTDDPFFRRFFDVPPDSRRDFESAGSGVIVNAEQGLVITNHHVIENAESEQVGEDSHTSIGRHKKGGWSQARYSRIREGVVQRFYDRTSEQVDNVIKENGNLRIIIAIEYKRATITG